MKPLASAVFMHPLMHAHTLAVTPCRKSTHRTDWVENSFIMVVSENFPNKALLSKIFSQTAIMKLLTYQSEVSVHSAGCINKRSRISQMGVGNQSQRGVCLPIV